jgi:hypothetical protein
MTRSRLILLLALVMLAVGLRVLLAGEEQVILCHRPPGNTSSATTIPVGASAVPAHLAHGDTLGACPLSPSK